MSEGQWARLIHVPRCGRSCEVQDDETADVRASARRVRSHAALDGDDDGVIFPLSGARVACELEGDGSGEGCRSRWLTWKADSFWHVAAGARATSMDGRTRISLHRRSDTNIERPTTTAFIDDVLYYVGVASIVLLTLVLSIVISTRAANRHCNRRLLSIRE